MSTNDSILKDPHEELPIELFAHSLSFLPPQSIAVAGAISRQWRINVNGNPALHREVDLSRLGAGKNAAILYHLTRFSFLALHTLVKVSLNLTSFYHEWNALGDQDVVQLDTLFMMLNQSKASLREIFFHFTQGEFQRGGDLKPFQFVLRLMKELQAFKDTRLVTIDAPLPLALKAGHEQQLSLTSSTMDYWSLSGSQVSRVLKEARKLVGSGVAGLSLLYETSEHVGKDEVMAELLDSSLVTLQHLDLNLILSNNDRKLWADSLNFRNLLSLRLYLWGSEEQEILLEVQEDIPTSKLLDLDLTLKDWEVDWESLGRWIGCSLERLTLSLDSRSSRGIEQLFERNSHSVNFNFKETLQILNLRNVSYEASSEIKVEADLFFPSLEEVSFLFFTTSAFDFFSNLTSPKLRFLSITSEVEEFGDLKSLFKMLKSHASQLVELHLNVLRKDSDPIPSGGSIFKKHPLRFECLQKLVLQSFFSKDTRTSLGLEENYYPNLVGLSISSDDDTFSRCLSYGKKSSHENPIQQERSQVGDLEIDWWALKSDIKCKPVEEKRKISSLRLSHQ